MTGPESASAVRARVARARVELDAAKAAEREERRAEFARRRAEEQARQEEHAARLAGEYLPNLSKSLTDLVYRQAWEDGHAEGYENVEAHYSELAPLVTLAYAEGKAAR